MWPSTRVGCSRTGPARLAETATGPAARDDRTDGPAEAGHYRKLGIDRLDLHRRIGPARAGGRERAPARARRQIRGGARACGRALEWAVRGQDPPGWRRRRQVRLPETIEPTVRLPDTIEPTVRLKPDTTETRNRSCRLDFHRQIGPARAGGPYRKLPRRYCLPVFFAAASSASFCRAPRSIPPSE